MSPSGRPHFLFQNHLTFGVRSNWSDWRAHPESAVCLFCDQRSETMDQIYTHMKVRFSRASRFWFRNVLSSFLSLCLQEDHGFDLQRLRTELSEYDHVKKKKTASKNQFEDRRVSPQTSGSTSR